MASGLDADPLESRGVLAQNKMTQMPTEERRFVSYLCTYWVVESAQPSRESPDSKMKRAGSRIRTDDLLITNQLLYQLSYAGEIAFSPGKCCPTVSTRACKIRSEIGSIMCRLISVYQ